MVQMLNEKPKLQQLTIKPFKRCECEMKPFEEWMNQMNISKTAAMYIVEKDTKSGITTWTYIPEEKKEKEMKETNLEHYKEQLKEILLFRFDNPRGAIKKIREIFGCQIKVERREHATDAILEWMAQPYKEQILDEVERKYLSDAIRPFRHRVESIAKCTNSGMYQIVIYFKDTKTWWFPLFPRESSMYKGMQTFKYYSLKELGL